MKTYAIIAVLLLLLCAFQCESTSPEPNPDYIDVMYGETQCADPWQRGTTDEQTLNNIEAFMREKNIRFDGTSIVQNRDIEAVCLACNCISGRVIYGAVHKDDLAKIKELKFSERN